MTGIRQWAFSLCLTMVACGIARMLLPQSNLEKMFRITVSVFFLCCVLSPFVLQSPQLRIQLEEITTAEIHERAEKLTQVVEKQSDAAAEVNISKILQEKLQQMGIKPRDITIHINTNGQNEEAVPVAEVVLDREYESQHAAIREELKSTLGLEVRLGYE